ncbi:unnamed protein product [Dicrocoelium dendriticum]|nr:unnamed protein product [Dicrocoelium dendriticum]
MSSKPRWTITNSPCTTYKVATCAPTEQDDRQTLQKARKSTTPVHTNTSSNGSVENRELGRLRFLNPGKAMKDLQFNWPEGNLTRNYRKQLTHRYTRKERDVSPAMYDSRGRLMGSLADTCDCLRESCPGCHLPCRRCHSTYCGPAKLFI